MRKGSKGLMVLMTALFAIGFAAGPAMAAVTLSEIRIDQPSTDNDEYFELAGEASESLSGITYVVIGDGTGGSGVIEAAVDLAGQSIQASGFFVAAESTFTIGTADLTVDLPFENSDNVTHLIVSGFSGAVADDLDTDDDGTLDVTPWTAIVDCVAIIETDPAVEGDQVYCATQVGPDGTYAPGQVKVCPDGWRVGAFDPTLGFDTPGAANSCEDCVDADGDNYEDEACGGDDCDDSDPDINPGAAEICEGGIDEDCDGYVDGDDWSCCTDFDGDNYFDVNDLDCNLGDDCNDAEPDINPGAQEICDDLVDNDCDDLVDQGDPDCVIVDDVFINEVRTDQDGDDNDEFFELIGPASTALDGLSYIVIGDGTGGSGVIEAIVDLAGSTIPASGLFVAAEATFTIGVADLTATLNFENGDNTTHMLVNGFGGSSGDDLDIDDDGVLDVTPWTAVVDCVAFIDTDPAVGGEQVYCTTQVGPDGSNPPALAYVCPGGWWMGPYETGAGIDTPGAANYCDCWDIDGDGFDDELCGGDDCEDGNEDIFPGAVEVCDDLIDNDCDDLADLDDPDCGAGCTDVDGDGYGDPASADCTYPEFDCDDGNAAIHPGMQGQDCANAPDGVDNDCDGQIDEDDCGGSSIAFGQQGNSRTMGFFALMLIPMIFVIGWRRILRR